MRWRKCGCTRPGSCWRGCSDHQRAPVCRPAQRALPARLAALTALTKIAQSRSGPGGFSPDLLAEAESLLARAGKRLRLSAAHTVVALAGGTGSGKSSLFNALAGADFSPSA